MHTRSIFKNMKEILKEKEDKGENIYKFQEVKINDVTCIFEIHFIKKIFVVKTKYTYVLFDEENNYYGKYIVHHLKYDDLEELLFHISKIYIHYSFYNGELLPNIEIKKKITEKKFICNNNASRCSVCYDETTEMTQCNHHICLKCREKILISDSISSKKCPICRDKDGIYYFKTASENIYNINHNDLDIINNEEILNNATDNRSISRNAHYILTPDEIPPILQMVLLREIINNNISYPALIIYSGFRTLYNYKWQIGFIFVSSFFILYAVNENFKKHKENCC